MKLIKLISPDGGEVMTTEKGVAALKANGYTDTPKASKKTAKKTADAVDDPDAGQDA